MSCGRQMPKVIFRRLRMSRRRMMLSSVCWIYISSSWVSWISKVNVMSWLH
jgi:hypothetical protein